MHMVAVVVRLEFAHVSISCLILDLSILHILSPSHPRLSHF